MFGLFKKKSPKQKLEKKYRKLLTEAHRLSTSNRKASDLKMAEADEVRKQIDAIKD